MPVRPLVLFPDLRLREAAAAISTFGPEAEGLAQDVVDTLGAVSAIGLTAPHIGVLQRIVAIRLEPGAETRVYVNPAVTWASPETAAHGDDSRYGRLRKLGRAASLRRGHACRSA